MLITRAGLIAGIAAGALALGACSSDKSPTAASTTSGGSTTSAASTANCATGTLKSEGSTAQKNAMDQWIQDYQTKCKGATVTYDGTGSGAGISNFIANQDVFVGSDSALNADKGQIADAAKRCGSPALDLPMVVGPIAIAYNIKGVSSLTLTPELVAKIFLGKIKTWNDPAIAAANSGVTLPATAITPFFRSDSSGTTENFEKYLAANASDVFTSKPDKDSSKAGFAGQGKAKSTGVQQAVTSTDGGIGYMEYSYAVQGNLNSAKIDNGAGAVELSPDTASAAIADATIASNGGSDLTLKLNYATKAQGAYPIVLVTYEVACSKYADSAQGALVKSFLTYTAGDGQAALKQLGYAPLPASIQSKVQASVATIS